MDPRQCGPSRARSRRNVLKVPTLVPLESSTPRGIWMMADGWLAVKISRFGGHITKHVAFPLQTQLISHKKSPRKLQSNNQTRKIKFPFWKKKHLPTLSSGSSFQFQKKEPCEAFLASGIGRTWGRTATSSLP